MCKALSAYIEAFLVELRQERARAVNTIAAYRYDLLQFSRYMQEPTEAGGDAPERIRTGDAPRLLRASDAEDYLQHLAQKQYAPATIARKQAVIATFCDWLATQSALDGKPPRPASHGYDAATASIATRSDLDSMLTVSRRDESPQGQRDLAILYLMLEGGLPASNIVALDRSAVVDAGEAFERRRGVERHPLSQDAKIALRRYLAEGRLQLQSVPGETALFLNHRGKRLTRQGVWLIVRRLGENARLASAITPQSLRRAYAINQIDGGIPPGEFAAAMGTSKRRSARDYQRMAKRTATSSITIDGVTTPR